MTHLRKGRRHRWGSSKPPIKGERFDKLVAVEEAVPRLSERYALQWIFLCDCGERFTSIVAKVRYNLRYLGWVACRTCYFAAGGWKVIAAARGDQEVENIEGDR